MSREKLKQEQSGQHRPAIVFRAPWSYVISIGIVGGLVYGMSTAVSGGGVFYVYLGSLGDGTLGQGLVWIPLVFNVSVLMLVIMYFLLFRYRSLSRAAFHILTVITGVGGISLSCTYYSWTASVITELDRETLVLDSGAPGDLFAVLGDEADGCFWSHSEGAAVLHVIPIDRGRIDRIYRLLRDEGHAVSYAPARKQRP